MKRHWTVQASNSESWAVLTVWQFAVFAVKQGMKREILLLHQPAKNIQWGEKKKLQELEKGEKILCKSLHFAWIPIHFPGSNKYILLKKLAVFELVNLPRINFL